MGYFSFELTKIIIEHAFYKYDNEFRTFTNVKRILNRIEDICHCCR